MKFFFTDKKFLWFLTKFLLTFCILYYGTIAFIGIAAPGGIYWKFADRWLDYVSGLRWFLLHCSAFVLKMAGFNTYLKDIYTIKMEEGLGVHVGYDCIGYGVMSSWIAFIIANQLLPARKIKWIAGGLLLIFFINVARICLMLIAVNRHWRALWGLDNHTWFNVAAYTAIFAMMWFFDRSQKKHGQANAAG